MAMRSAATSARPAVMTGMEEKNRSAQAGRESRRHSLVVGETNHNALEHDRTGQVLFGMSG